MNKKPTPETDKFFATFADGEAEPSHAEYYARLQDLERERDEARERHADHSQTSVTTMKNQTHTGAALPQPRLVRPLEVGCVVTTNGGKKHTIAEIGFGGSEGVAEHPFYHWDKDWPYEIEHAAMNPETDAIVSVSWPNAESIHGGKEPES